MTKLYYLFLLFIGLTFSNISNAHVTQSSVTKLSILSNGQFSITLQADLLHVLQQNIINKKQNDEELINQLQSMRLTEQIKLLLKTKNYIKSNTFIRFDKQRVMINSLQGPTVNEVKKLINSPAGNQGYPITYVGTGSLPIEFKSVTVQLPDLLGSTLLSVAKPNRIFVNQGVESQSINLSQSPLTINQLPSNVFTALTYAYQGFIHIIPKGLDHILFVLALFLLTAKFSTLLWQVSAFTLAHTITLALGIFGIVNISASIVEPLIALSIAYVAIENIYAEQLRKWRIVVIFVFGLLHGLGFASVLLELGLAPSQYLISLIAFNVGVEIAQITVLLIALLCLYRFQKKSWYRQRIIQPFSVLIALVALYWFFERIV